VALIGPTAPDDDNLGRRPNATTRKCQKGQSFACQKSNRHASGESSREPTATNEIQPLCKISLGGVIPRMIRKALRCFRNGTCHCV